MKCDDFLPYLESGGIGQQLLARIHATRCPRCAALRKAWTTAKGQLTRSEPLTLNQRRVWERAAGEVVAQPIVRLRPIPTAFVTALAACVMIAVVWTVARVLHPPPLSEPRTDTGQLAQLTSIREIGVSEEFDSLETRVEQLKLALAELVPQAELLDARHQVNELINQYSKW
jgi:hypothetical protein